MAFHKGHADRVIRWWVHKVVSVGAGTGLLVASCSSSSHHETIPSNPQTSGTTPISLAAETPTLGHDSRQWVPGQPGARTGSFGEVRPTGFFLGGDPTGLVWDIKWQSWGQSEAVGSGLSYYAPPDGFVSGAYQAHTTVVAFDLGICDHRLMYRALEWYFPTKGQSFDPRNYINVCSGTFVDNGVDEGP